MGKGLGCEGESVEGWGKQEKVWSVTVHTLGEGQMVESERAQLGAVMMTND